MDTKAATSIEDSHVFDGDATKLSEYYRRWANSYDSDVITAKYQGPEICAKLVNQYLMMPKIEAVVLDAGCGTGLSGLALRDHGFARVDGIDLSHDMIAKAAEKGVYRWVAGGMDMNVNLKDIRSLSYDAVVCCGVFTLGHVKPSAIKDLLRVTRSGGIVVASTRVSYCDKERFDEYIEEFIKEGSASQLARITDAPYVSDEGAHYWVFKKS